MTNSRDKIVIHAGEGATHRLARAISADPPTATKIHDGDRSVSTQTGALLYAYPIEATPGGNCMVSRLALSYSSQARLYRGIAGGWSWSVAIPGKDARATLHGSEPNE